MAKSLIKAFKYPPFLSSQLAAIRACVERVLEGCLGEAWLPIPPPPHLAFRVLTNFFSRKCFTVCHDKISDFLDVEKNIPENAADIMTI
jgi:hypothetical protein